MFDLARLRMDLLALISFAGVAFLTVSLMTYHPADAQSGLVYPPAEQVMNLAGARGAIVAAKLMSTLGVGAYALLGLLFAWNLSMFRRDSHSHPAGVLLGIGCCLAAICMGLSRSWPSLGPATELGSGGYTGVALSGFLSRTLDPTGVLVLTIALLAGGLILLADLPIIRSILGLPTAPLAVVSMFGSLAYAREKNATDRMFERAMQPQAAEEEAMPLPEPVAVTTVDESEHPADDEVETVTRVALSSAPKARSTFAEFVKRGRRLISVAAPTVASPAKDMAPVDARLPKITLLEEPEDFPYEQLMKKARIAASTLERTFEEFNLNIRVVDIETGPVVTQFELELEKGLRLSKVTSLADDLAIALRVPSVRVVAPIPGKNTVGVEVPNEDQVMVRMRDLIEGSGEEAESMRIPLFVGKDVAGRGLAVDMAKMPHLLIAGRTGTGKSVCLNTLILSILMTRTPDQVRMLMIDPKMVELSPYRRVPHLMHPVITDMKKAEAVLGWAVQKMDERYDLLSKVGVRHLDGYNKLGREKLLERIGIDEDHPKAEDIPDSMPYIVIIADEMADMMMTSGKDVEASIIRLAQKSRAVGIHLVLATQKPTVDVITGLIKSNLPARISFQVASRTDSRVVLDEQGADKLLGMGDMLYLAPGTSNLTRAQGTYVSDDEINRVIDFYSDQPPQYEPELESLGEAPETADGIPDVSRHQDEMYGPACEVVIREGRGSVSLLQRCLGIGYGRAARLIDYMAEDGIVGEYNGSQAREVLYNMDDWKSMQ